jgi:DNA-directed RNA polymerase specialized sigma24 family protein
MVSPPDYQQLDEQRLIRLAQEGDMDAFTEVVRRYKDRMTQYAVRFLGDNGLNCPG